MIAIVRRIPLLRGLLLALSVSATPVLLLAQDPIPEPPAPETKINRTEIRNYLRDIMARYEIAPGDVTAARHLSAPRRQVMPPRARFDPMANRNNTRLDSLDKRAERRAYDGAPPVMPHSKNFARTKSCIECHEQGMYLGSKYARPMSHAYLVNCEQCHVESKHLYLESARRPADNNFKGLHPPVGGMRASTVSPPVMPHGTMMRVNCLACHGPNGYQGLRTAHPERLNCVQCHGIAAGYDQTSPFYTGTPGLTLPRNQPQEKLGGIVNPKTLESSRRK